MKLLKGKICLVTIWKSLNNCFIYWHFYDRDYENLPELDTYDYSQIDDNDYDEIDPAARLEAEKEIKKIRKTEMRGTNLERRQNELLYGIFDIKIA